MVLKFSDKETNWVFQDKDIHLDSGCAFVEEEPYLKFNKNYEEILN